MNFNLTALFILVGVISFGLILLSSIKLIKTKNIPGSKLIFISILSFVVAALFPDFEEVSAEYSLIIAGMSVAISSIGMLVGAYGFMLLTNYVIKENANK